MNTTRSRLLRSLVAIVLVTCCAGQGRAEKIYYGVELNGVLCGYAEVETSEIQVEGAERILLKHRLFTMVTALGAKVNAEIDLTYHIDPATGQFTYHDSKIKQGEMELGSEVRVEGNRALFTSTLTDEETVVELEPDVIRPNTLFYPHLKRDFAEGRAGEKTYRILEVREFEVQETTYTRAGSEQLELAGQSFDTVILDMLSHATGVKGKVWLDVATGRIVKTELPNRRTGYLADASVKKNIEAANLDESIAAKVNVAIADVQAISFMKVRATVEPFGIWVTPESLNIPGQSFSGTVRENRIEGVFEVAHARYDGTGAPAFPPDFTSDESLKPYLEAESMIQSDDPVLIRKARKITEGSRDSWEASQRLGRWVAEKIDYAIPGGGSARGAYDARAGECGAHSFLFASFCRSVGIPARVVWGCMYIPNFGGAFGQHAWNEIYMGEEAGWVPVDTTAMEIDFVDSGHIRIGEYESMTTALNPVEFEVLDYRVGSDGESHARSATDGRYAPFLGKYDSTAGSMTMEILVQDGSMAVDIPGKVKLALNDPDEDGRWYCKMTNRLYLTFEKDESGAIAEMQMHEIVRMQRASAPESVEDDVPERFRPYLGTFRFAQVQADFTVLYRDGSLAVEDPLAKRTIRLRHPDEKGRWRDEFDKNEISFDRDDDGNVTAMVIDATGRFRRAQTIRRSESQSL